MKRAGLLIIFLAVWIFPGNLTFAADTLRISFIDVGYGDAILVQSSGKNALIDTGGLLYGYKLTDYLRKNKVRKIDYLIITHPDLDHMAAAFFIVPKFPIGKIFDNAQVLDDEHINRWYKKLIRQRENYSFLVAGDILRMGKAQLEVIWPDKPNPTDSINANSLVIMLRFKDFRCLFTGDLTEIGEQRLLKQGADVRSDVLKIGHHGFRDATSEEFLQQTQARFAIISTGEEEKRGTPSEEVISLINNKGIKIYRTDIHGDITVGVDKDGAFTIITEK